MTTAPQILCIGSVLWDIIGRSASHMRQGSDVPGRITRIPGGVVLNIAMTLARFGMRPVLLSAIGQDADQFLTVSRKQELPFHDPRLKNVTGLGYALSPTGADHEHNLIDNFANFPGSEVCKRLEEMGQEVPIPLFGITEEKVTAYHYEVAVKHVMDSALICHFYPYEYKHLVVAFQAAGGWSDFDSDEINKIGWRIITMGRMFVLREGSGAEDDKLAPKSYQALDTGPIAGRIMPEDDLVQGLLTYYQLMGWDEKGQPEVKRLSELGIDQY